MGLDISFYATTTNAVSEDADCGFKVRRKVYDIQHEFGYFRGDSNLRDIIFEYYVSNGGTETKGEFNCMDLRVTQNLVNYVRKKYQPTYDYYKELMKTLKQAEEYMRNEQLALYCNCWW